MISPSTNRRHERNRRAVAAFTADIGTRVIVTRDNGDELATFTTTRAFLLDGKHALIQVGGIPGNVRLSRVRVVGTKCAHGGA